MNRLCSLLLSVVAASSIAAPLSDDDLLNATALHRGHDIKALVKSLQAIKAKGEFESGSSAQARIQAEIAAALGASPGQPVRVAFSLGREEAFSFKYNADAQMVEADSLALGLTPLVIASVTTEREPFEGTTPSGAKASVRSVELVTWEVEAVMPTSCKRYKTLGLPLAGAVASKALPGSRMVLIGTLLSPPTRQQSNARTATLSDPVQVTGARHIVRLAVEQIALVGEVDGAHQVLLRDDLMPAKQDARPATAQVGQRCESTRRAAYSVTAQQ